MQFKKATLLGATGVLAITLSVAGVAYAVPDNNATSGGTVNSVTKKDGVKVKIKESKNFGDEFAGILGMDANVLRQELRSGKTLAQIAATQGMDANTLTQKLQAAFDDRIDKAVANGKLTADQAAAMKAKTAAKAASMINKTWTERQGTAGKENLFKNVRQQIPALLGNMDAAQLKAELKSGKSLAQIAQDNGISKDKLISDLQAMMKADLDQAVKDNKITAEKATQIESKLPQMIERMVTRVHKDQ